MNDPVAKHVENVMVCRGIALTGDYLTGEYADEDEDVSRAVGSRSKVRLPGLKWPSRFGSRCAEIAQIGQSVRPEHSAGLAPVEELCDVVL
jgi:hypothetical protein